MEQAILKELYNILDQYKKPSFLIERKIHRCIESFIKEKFKDSKLSANSPLNYETRAFAFGERDNCPEEWGNVSYSPLIGNIDPITKKYQTSYPGISQITPEVLNYWEERSSEVSNPILQCRYAGLVWDFSPKIRGKKADIFIAYKFIDSIIKMAELGGDRFLKYKLERALRLAVSINNRDRISSLKDTIINYEDTHSEDNKSGTWGYSFDLLIGDKDLYKKIELKKEQENKIIKNLEKRLTLLSDKDSDVFSPYNVEHIISKLVPYYNNRNDKKNMKRVLLIYRDSFLSILEKGIGIPGSVWLEKVRKILFQYGLSQEAKDIEENLRKAQKEDLKLLKKHKIPINIPGEKVDDYIKGLDEQTLFEALNTIAISFIPDKDQSKEIVHEIAQKHPLQFIISSSNIMDHTGRKVAEVGPLQEDLDGRIIYQMKQSLLLTCYMIELGLNHLEKTKLLNADTLAKHLFESPFFLKEQYQIIKEGLIAYFNKNYIASCSVLIPQVESVIREIMVVAGGVIYQPSRSSNEKGLNLRPLGSLLRDEVFINIFEEFNKNIPIYFQILLIDPIGFNFRNNICHGHFPADHFNKTVANYIIHILLILSIFKKSEEKKA